MTEFYDLGAHCQFDGCNQKDFLPFKCDKCNKYYCLAHRTLQDHKCPFDDSVGVVAPFCPLCNQVLPYRASERENPNDVVERHISSGKCPGLSDNQPSSSMSSTGKSGSCSFPNCEQHGMIICKSCNRTFCVQHRLDFDHNCEALKKTNTSSSKQAQTPFKIFSGASSSIAANKWKNNKKEVGKLLNNKFQNKAFQPIGQSSIEQQDRYYLDVYFPLNSNIAPVHMFFSKNWSLGKVLDKIAEQGKVKNNNSSELDVSKRLHLFTFDGNRLPTDKKLCEIESSILKSRDGVILEYGEALDPNLVDEKLKSISSNTDTGCVLC
ncbi:hypothetical protein C9374_010162 [Naegleria lovaniensis]|uniref:AN1-type domain-containing protein n=1 Tax=Naegleria lovaniensis TaxID=51637 RepID=A0AA88GH97_NAELO|nr:uncharacterized protein C9374_010162 [Naegleria lovaniensis]KAG2375158.1 hypothetical protein C9374_010162 [Naegleria lovaniensis]